MAWEEEAHPRGAAGTATGGQFVAKDSGQKSASGAKTSKARPGDGGKKSAPKDGTLAYDPKTGRGTGYGVKGGDPRVRALQQALTRLGLTDASGKKLVLDGQLGPKTTQAIKAAQQRLGLPADGKVTPDLLKKLVGMRGLPKAAARKRESEWAGVPLSAHPSPAVRMMALARLIEAWDPAKHPRVPKGSPGGGRFLGGSAVGAALDGGFPKALDGFGREELRREARRRGIELRRGAAIEDIRNALHDHANKQRGSANGDERRKPELTSQTPEQQVADAYKALAAEPGDWVGLADLRARLSDKSRIEQDRTLTEMAMRPDVVFVPEENQKTLTAEDREAAIYLGGEDKHLIQMTGKPEGNSGSPRKTQVPIAKPQPKPEPAKAMTPEATLAAAPKAVDGAGSRKIDRAGTAALERYRGKAFTEINGDLRGGTPSAKTSATVAQIDRVHAASKLTEDVVVHRGIGNVEAVFGPAARRKLTGAEWRDDAYQSTSADADVAERFLISEEGRRAAAVMKVRVPAGIGAIQLSDGNYEAEMLLERGLRMRVISDTGPWRRGQKNPRTIEVEVVPV